MNDSVLLYLSPEHACGYLPRRAARNAYIDPALELSSTRYGWLLEQGFRRSGVHAYRPHCANCHLCLPARVPVAEFSPSRAQKRCLARNQDLRLEIVHQLGDEHFDLYGRYLQARHADGGMEPDNRQAFHQFLECPWGEVQFWEFRAAGKLLALSVVDRLPLALSAVYTCFDPAQAQRGLGNYAILRQIELAAEAQLPHVYLGYWVPGSRKMQYKRQFQPLEIFSGGQWRRLEHDADPGCSTGAQPR